MASTTPETRASADQLVQRCKRAGLVVEVIEPSAKLTGVSWITAGRQLETRSASRRGGSVRMSMPLADAGHGLEEEPPCMRWRRAFPGHAEQARSARDFVAFLLAGCALADDAVLAVAELVANALRHTRSALPCGLFAVEVRRWSSGASVGVTDQGGTSEPKVREADDLAESGRGLKAVATLASRWDWTGDGNGRTVIAVFDER